MKKLFLLLSLFGLAITLCSCTHNTPSEPILVGTTAYSEDTSISPSPSDTSFYDTSPDTTPSPDTTLPPTTTAPDTAEQTAPPSVPGSDNLPDDGYTKRY